MDPAEKQSWQGYQAKIVDATAGAFNSDTPSSLPPKRSHHKDHRY
jgi:hypothetical protein